ncbi:MAG: type II toxin-antitoxin system RelE/ParE family toxin [Nanoarchaeota archaeon]
MYEIEFTNKAKSQLKKLYKEIQQRIILVLERVKIRPEKFFKKLVGDKSYRLRVEDYRVIADINKNKLLILILKIGHRRSIYG